MKHQSTLPSRQQGIALITALMFLVIITLIALNDMQTSTMELKMSSNEQLRLEAMQSAQSALDNVINKDYFAIKTAGYTLCINKQQLDDGTACDDYELSVTGNGYDATHNTLEIVQDSSGAVTCRQCESSLDKFSVAAFNIRSNYEEPDHGARAEIHQGVVKLIPKGQ